MKHTYKAMTDLETYELSDIDPEDISDILLKVEKSFDFKFGKNELRDVKSFGELCDIIRTKVQGENINDCTTQQAFYKLRNALVETLSIDKDSIKSETSLQELITGESRRQKISAIDKNVGFKTRTLRAKHWLTGSLLLTLIVSFLGLFLLWKIALPVFAMSIIGLKLSDKFGNEFDFKTVGELAEKISREHYKEVRRNNQTFNPNEITAKVRELFKHDLDLKESALTREATFDKPKLISNA